MAGQGTPSLGFRITKNLKWRAQEAGYDPGSITPDIAKMLREAPIVNGRLQLPRAPETDEEILNRIQGQFTIIREMAQSVTEGSIRSLVISGPPGLGKSYGVEQVVKKWDPDGDYSSIIKGYVRTTGLYRTLYKHRHKGHVVVLDDADTIFSHEDSLNILKAATDTSDQRIISYLAEMKLLDDETGEALPRSFEFEGAVIFLTNYDLNIEKHKFKVHFDALVSRAYYIDCAMAAPPARDYLIWLKHLILKEKMLINRAKLNLGQQEAVIKFLNYHYSDLIEVSARMALKLAHLCKTHPTNWHNVAKFTCFKK